MKPLTKGTNLPLSYAEEKFKTKKYEDLGKQTRRLGNRVVAFQLEF